MIRRQAHKMQCFPRFSQKSSVTPYLFVCYSTLSTSSRFYPISMIKTKQSTKRLRKRYLVIDENLQGDFSFSRLYKTSMIQRVSLSWNMFFLKDALMRAFFHLLSSEFLFLYDCPVRRVTYHVYVSVKFNNYRDNVTRVKSLVSHVSEFFRTRSL